MIPIGSVPSRHFFSQLPVVLRIAHAYVIANLFVGKIEGADRLKSLDRGVAAAAGRCDAAFSAQSFSSV